MNHKVRTAKPKESTQAAVLLGVGMMAALDEIIFHQVLSWHHFYDRSTTEIALLSDGLLHSAELIAIVAGFFMLLDLKRSHSVVKARVWAGFFLGLGGFQLFDGLVDHKVLRLHQVRYVDNLLPYDIAWNAVGLVLLFAGLFLLQRAVRLGEAQYAEGITMYEVQQMQHTSHHSLHQPAFLEWLPVFLVLAVAFAYLYAVATLRGKKSKWSLWRTASFMAGLFLVATALVPALAQWAHSDLRGHMVQHLLLGMFSPIFLVLGTPVTLALIASPVQVARQMTAVLKTNFFYVISHPVTGLLLNMGGMYLLYLTPLYNQSLSKPYLHYILHLHFLGVGYLFTWSIIGADPTPKRPALQMRVMVLFFSIASHAFLSKFMYAHLFPLHSPHSAEQIRAAAKLMYYWGDLSELLLAIILFTLWYQSRGRAPHGSFPLVCLNSK